MMKDQNFSLVGPNYAEFSSSLKIDKSLKQKIRELPLISIVVLGVILACCLGAEVIMNHDPVYMDLQNVAQAPNGSFYFGTDLLGRDIFSMIWYGGRISLFIGVVASEISTVIAVVYGCISGLSNEWIDDLMMRCTEILMSIPSILIIIFIQAMIGQTNPLSIAFVIGITNWMSISKIVRNEMRQIRNSDYILASKTMGSNFGYRLSKHLLPNFVSSIMFMVVMNVSSAIGTEATLSFLGIGLPTEIISWGSMLSNADKALLSNYWWIILTPGIFLVMTLVSLADIGNYIRKMNNRGLKRF